MPLVRRDWTAEEGDTLRKILAILVPESDRDDPSDWLTHFALANSSVLDVFPVGVDDVPGRTLLQLATGDSKIGDAEALTSLMSQRQGDRLRPGVKLGVLVRTTAVTLSETKLPLAHSAGGSSESASLTFSCSAPAAQRLRFVTTRLAFEIQAIEYDIRSVPESKYESSRWLSFVRPPEPEHLGTVDIPIPLRQLPAEPVVNVELAKPAQADVSQLALVDLKKYDYRLEFSADPAPQDELFVNVAVNGDLSNSESGTRRVNEDLAEALAKFAASDIQQAMQDLFDGETKPDEELIPPLEAFLTMAETVAEAFGPANGDSSAGDPNHVFRKPLNQFRLPVAKADCDGCYKSKILGLDAIREQHLWGSVTVVRNARLLAGRDTDPRFVSHSPQARKPPGVRPSLKCDVPVDCSLLSPLPGFEAPTLINRVCTLFHWLSGASDLDTSNLDVQVSAKVSNVLTRGADGSEALTTTRPGLLGLLQELSEPMCEALAEAMLGLAEKENLLDKDGRWVLSVQLFPKKKTGKQKEDQHAEQPLSAPLIELTNLWLPFDSVAAERKQSSRTIEVPKRTLGF